MPRPSFGCSTCRSRRIKCDERPGGCLNCERHRVPCPGYPERFDVVLRLQTGGAQTQSLPNATHSHPLATTSSYSPINDSVNPDLEHLTLGVFYSTQCIDGSVEWALERVKAQSNGCLFAAIMTLGSIQIAKKWSLPNDTPMVARNYIKAIQLLNAALSSSSESSKDSTLLATLIMSAIETRAAPNQSTQYWEEHAKGAASLLQLRGPGQVTSIIGAALYFQVSSLLTTSCLLGNRAIPPELEQLRETIRQYVLDDSHPLWRHQGAIFRFVNYVARLTNEESDNQGDYVMDALKIYKDLLFVFDDAGPDWQFQRLPSDRIPGLLDYQHTFVSVIASQLWSSHHAAIMRLCASIAVLARDRVDEMMLTDEARELLENASEIMNRTALDTLAGAPHAVELITLVLNEAQVSDGTLEICRRGYSHHKPVFEVAQPDIEAVPYMHGCNLQYAIYWGAESAHIRLDIRRHLWRVLESGGRRIQSRQWQDLAEHLRPTLQQ